MLRSDLRKKIDALWNKFWSGGLANPLMAIDQMNYLIFLKRLEDKDNAAAQSARARGQKYVSLYAAEDAQDCRWSYWRNLPGDEMVPHVQGRVFRWMKGLAPENHAFTQYLEDATFLIQKPSLLVEAVNIIDDLAIADQNIDTQGDIYEYMLSRLSVAGQIGQFRTPRHIIRAMVELADLRFGQRVLDPACGTGGFLIAAYQNLIAQGTSAEFLTTDEDGAIHGLVGDRLTESQWEWLRTASLAGYDFDPSMVRIAAMNMVLHGIETPQVNYADALGKSFSHAARAQVVLANPPFSGSVESSEISDEFRFSTKKTEQLFLQLFEDVLTPGGRAVVIVPQGILLGNHPIPTSLRQRLIENNVLEAVIALPHSTFKPYASVATAILVFRKGGSTERVWMYQVEEDGFTQNAARLPIAESDLPDLHTQWSRRSSADYSPAPGKHGWVELSAIRKRGLELWPQLYLRSQEVDQRFPTASLKDLCNISKGQLPASKAVPGGEYRLVTTSEEPKFADSYHAEGESICIPLVSSTGHGHASIKRLTYVPSGKFSAATIVAILQVKDPGKVHPRFLYYYLEAHKDEILVPLMKGSANVSLSLSKIGSVSVPVPDPQDQMAYISTLADIDDSITQLNQQVELMREQRFGEFELFRSSFSASQES
ncbi:type I restriction enzyme M protein [Krasilnikovia cinnamomea]|uniref:site-specific DNA-methyltransferase (adenine-specific) n=1 Tax=Krasilnikovia cinnamomea TaxID=349313 RepID=A0A4Q7ZGR6_9ACTN|nr:N-6 DNA methylase [Krasilnikovia cinnamomea]RZU49967.1 type I restriction enzyme M protein [Krasilnikovia cinnamomea]